MQISPLFQQQERQANHIVEGNNLNFQTRHLFGAMDYELKCIKHNKESILNLICDMNIYIS